MESKSVSPSLEVLQSWGVASARHSSGCPVHSASGDSEHLYDVPLGPSVVRWDLNTSKRLMQFQAHSDLITCARKSPDGHLIASSAYSGGVKLWSPKWECLDSTTAPMESQFHLAWSQDSSRFLIIGNGWKSSIVMYNICTEQSTSKLQQAWTLPATDSDRTTSAGGGTSDSKDTPTPHVSSSAVEESERESSRNYPYEEAFFMAEFNPSGNIFAVREVPYRTTQIHLISSGGDILKTVDLLALVGDGGSASRRPVNTLFISVLHCGVYAIGLEGGRIAILDAELLQLNKVFKVGSGFRTAVWDGDLLVLPTDSGRVMWWNTRSGEKVAEFESGLQDYVMHMDWSVSRRGLWICGFSCLLFLALNRNDAGVVESVGPSLAVRGHELTSVGVGFDPSGRKIASGDMVGNVWVTERERVLPLHRFSVSGSVRCLVWESERGVFVGTLDGGLYWWGTGDSQPTLLVQRQGSIIHMQLDQSHKRLAVGTSKGVLAVYELVESERGSMKCNVVIEMNAHPPQPGPQDQRFGQLGKQAEIWSLCWSPEDTRLATCSEDQTVKVWDTHTWTSIAVLRGHTLAVTSVDWRQHRKWSLLASCSDDRTVRLVNGESYELLCVVNTKDIYGWHTLTYLSFYPHKDHCLLLCTTQNGHLVMWGVAAGDEGVCPLKRLWKGKVHLGSVEGLAWQDKVEGGSLVTVGADCIVNLFKLDV